MLALSIQDQQQAAACIKCCCETVSLKPGETQPLLLNYAPWALPIAQRGLHCLPSVEIEEKETCDAPGGDNLPPQVIDQTAFSTPVNTALNGDLNTKVSDPESAELTFKLLPHYGPKKGKLVLNEDGTFVYTPQGSYKGEERFYATASDGTNKTTFEVMIAVGVVAASMIPTPDLAIGTPIVDQRYYTVRLPLVASPAARSCQIFRLSIRQGALDCDCNCYYHVDCVDVRIANC